MHSGAMKAALTYPPEDGSAVNTSACKGFNGMKAIFSDVGDM